MLSPDELPEIEPKAPPSAQQRANRLADQVEPLESQVDRLAEVIIATYPGEPSQSQGVIDTAIRLMTRSLPDPDWCTHPGCTNPLAFHDHPTPKQCTHVALASITNATYSGCVRDFEHAGEHLSVLGRAWSDQDTIGHLVIR